MRHTLLALFLVLTIFFSHGDVEAQVFAPAPAEATEPTADSAKALIGVLKDETARAALIRELERLGEPVPADIEQSATTPKREKPFSRRIAETSEKFVESLVERAETLGRQLLEAPDQLSGLLEGEAAIALVDATIELALLIVATVATFLLLRRISRRMDRRLGESGRDAGFRRTLLLILTSIIIDICVVLLAWAAGYVVAVMFIGPVGDLGIRESMYLNAFLVVELVKVALRTVLSPNTAMLRPIAIPDGAAKKMSRWLSVVVSVLGYGQLLLAPVVSEQASWLAGQSMVVLVALIALLMLITLTLSNRRAVADWLLVDRNMSSGPRFTQSLAHAWHWPLMLYLIALFVIVLTRPGGVLLPVLGASAQILAAVIGGAMAAQMISRSIAKGVHLPEHVNQRLPLLERRLNVFVPKALALLRILIAAAVVAFALNSIGVLDLNAWLEGNIGYQATASIISVLMIMIASFGIWLGVSSYIDYRLNPDFGAAPTAREKTLLTLGRNAFTILLIAIAGMFALSEIGLDIAPLLASAGVLGLAIGFGAQKMVQDIITGVFIQFENAINVGDVVTVGGTTGAVEALTIRSVSLRDVHGVFHIIPFSSVDMVSNYMRGFGLYVMDMGIAYREDIDEAKAAMFDAFTELRATQEWGQFIIADLDWMGLNSFGDSAVVLRARVKCVAGKQWAVGRAYNAILKRVFDARGIEIPFPHQTIYFGEDKNGAAPPAHVALTEKAQAKPSTTATSDADAQDASDGDDASTKLDVPDSDGDSENSRE